MKDKEDVGLVLKEQKSLFGKSEKFEESKGIISHYLPTVIAIFNETRVSNLDLTGQPTFASHFGGVLIDMERQFDEVGLSVWALEPDCLSLTLGSSIFFWQGILQQVLFDFSLLQFLHL